MFKSNFLQRRKKEDEKYRQIVKVNYKLEEIVYLLDVVISVYDKRIVKRPICNVSEKRIAIVSSVSFFFLFEAGRVGTLKLLETYFSC